MYHHHHQDKSMHPSTRMSISERHLFLQGGNGNGDSGLVLSTDAKPRLKWTPDLHERFIEAVNQLGGADSKCTQIYQFQDAPGRCYFVKIINCNILLLQKPRQNQF